MTQKELEEILQRHCEVKVTEAMNTKSITIPLDDRGNFANIDAKNHPYISISQALKALKEAYNKGVTDSAESAEADYISHDGEDDFFEDVKVNKQSILKLLIKP